MRWLIVIAGLLAIGAMPAPKPVPMNRFIEWDARDGPRSYRAGDITVTLSRSGKSVDAPPTLTISAPGVPSFTVVNEDSGSDIGTSVAIGPLARGQKASVIFQTWTGGAHCCMHVVVAARIGNRFRRVDLGEWDRDSIKWPSDISGDGIVDFQLSDDAFNDVFSSFAGSWGPPLIMNVRGGKAINVSTEPAFKPLFERDLAAARKRCLAGISDTSRGACAGYAADAARLGRFKQARIDIVRLYGAAEPDFMASIGVFLRKHGYLK